MTDCPDCPQCKEKLRRQQRFAAAMTRVRRTGSPAARAELRDARIDLDIHGETPEAE